MKKQSVTSQLIENQPTERQPEEGLDNDSPPQPLKPKTKSQELAGLETSLGDASRPPVERSHRNHASKNKLTESAQLDLEDEEFQDVIPIDARAAISNNHNHEDGIDNPQCYNAATKSPLAEQWDMVMKQQ